jgi:hypothetical protein
LQDESGFQLALDPLGDEQDPDFPEWFHFGFCLKNMEEVKKLYEKMKLSGVEFSREYKEFGEDAANFYCWAPGPYRMEIAWNRDD